MKRKHLLSNSLLGIILMCAGQLSFALNDCIVKFSVQEANNNISVINVIFIRGLFTTFFIFLYLNIIDKKNIFEILKIKSFHIRGLFEVMTALFFFTGLILMPVSNVYTLLMTNPFFVTIFAFIFLKEKVGIRRWFAVILGFIGVIIVINPQNMNISYFFIFPILAAMFLTIRDVRTKGIVTKSNNFEIIFVTSVLMTIFSGIGSIFFEFSLTLNQLPQIMISSIFLSIAYLFSVMTIFYAPLSLSASARYSVVIFGIIFGYLILDEIPTYNMFFGALIIIFSGLFVIKRQKDLGKII